jgi:hypothetical protein
VEVYLNGLKLGSCSVIGWPHAGDGGRIGISLEGASSTRLDDFGGGSSAAATVGQSESVVGSALSDQGLEPAPSANAAPLTLELSRCFPNPFARETQVRFGLPSGGSARLRVYDVQGRQVTTLVNGPQSAGWHSVIWNGRGLDGARARAGVYFLRLESGGLARARRIVLAP